MCEFLTAEELADYLRLQPGTIRNLARRGTIPAIRLSQKVVRFDPRAVVRALERLSHGATAVAKEDVHEE